MCEKLQWKRSHIAHQKDTVDKDHLIVTHIDGFEKYYSCDQRITLKRKMFDLKFFFREFILL